MPAEEESADATLQAAAEWYVGVLAAVGNAMRETTTAEQFVANLAWRGYIIEKLET